MMIKVNDEYLDFNGDIQVDRQIIKVETLDKVGSFSYSFKINDTDNNRRILGIQSINVKNKSIYTLNNTELQNDSGVTLYKGSLRVDNIYTLDCSFFSGNNNWFSLVNGYVKDVDLSTYDSYANESDIVSSWSRDYGIVWPLVDKGILSERRYNDLVIRPASSFNDFHPFIYVKNVVHEILKQSGIKLSGDLLNDPTYNSLITTNNGDAYTKDEINDRTIFVGKTSSQALINGTFSKVTFDDYTTFPWYNSTLMNFDPSLNRWVADRDQYVKIDFNFALTDSTKQVNVEFRRNNVDIGSLFLKGGTISGSLGTLQAGFTRAVKVLAGEYIEIFAEVDGGAVGTLSISSGDFTVTPLGFVEILASQLLPYNKKSIDFLKDVFNLFNVIFDYDNYSKTLNTVLFKNVINRDEQDLSQYIDRIIDIDTTEVISDYSKENILSYNTLDIDEITRYNNTNNIPYAAGSLDVQNEYLDKKNDLVSVDFTSPFSYFNNAFGLQLIRLGYLNKTENTQDPIAISTVLDDSGVAQFQGTGAGSAFTPGSPQVIRHADFTVDYYNGDWIAIPPFIDANNYKVSGANYAGAATGNLLSSTFIQSNDTDQIIALNIINLELPVPIRFHTLINSTVTLNTYNNASVAVFDRFKDGTILDSIKQSISFGRIDNVAPYQVSLKDTYYSGFESLLNDPLLLRASMYLTENVFLSIDLTKPVRIKYDDFNDRFIINKITGYVDSKTPCIIELIKLP